MPKKPDFESSTLWRVSGFDRLRDEIASSEGMERQTLLPSTLLAELGSLEKLSRSTDVLEVAAACLRSREPALLYMQFGDLVWPLTLFPNEQIYHSPRSLMAAAEADLATLTVLHIEPAAVRPPGHWMHERVGNADWYHPLKPALWRLALHARRNRLLAEIGGLAAYRVLRGQAAEGLTATGALGATIDRLHREAAPLKDIARWPGMSTDRATSLLNALYMASNLLVTRTGPAARAEPAQGLLGRWRR